MDAETTRRVVAWYAQGSTVREIALLLDGAYGRESIRCALHHANAPLRGRGTKYLPVEKMSPAQNVLFAEFLGYLYGDGHVTRNTTSQNGSFSCVLAFATNEQDLVRTVCAISVKLFGFAPIIKDCGGWTLLKFRRSFAKYLAEFGYPVGKKSVLNPHLPLAFFDNVDLKKAFIRGFLNAEASVHKTVFIHQSVRVSLTEPQRALLRAAGHEVLMKGKTCFFIPWSNACSIIGAQVTPSNILQGMQLLLADVRIPSDLYPIRAYVGFSGVTSVHFELRIRRQHIKRVAELSLISSEKKLKKLESMLRG